MTVPQRITAALDSMENRGPKPLRLYLRSPAPDFEPASDNEIRQLLVLMLADDPNAPARLRFSHSLRTWDNAKGSDWCGATPRNSRPRRDLIYGLLQLEPDLVQRVEALIPFYPLDEPLIIAEDHQDWYKPQAGARDYYWRTYRTYLQQRGGWPETSLLTLENSTRAIIECFSNPSAAAAYASRGLVVGYVQSGKTASFTGVIARAADAGYRLIIVLAGTWNILRNQTQRRLDKELLGKQFLSNDLTYSQSPPPDWDEFLDHGVNPTSLGHFGWQRLTRPDIDFQKLKAAIDNLEYQRVDQSLPIFHPTNLDRLPVKLLVVKKHAGVLANLVGDLKLLSTRLDHLPALVIDDESDQAGINIALPDTRASGRSPTNEQITELLKLLPRGQYVGYTATPYANALINPDDEHDIFPRDFIVSLDRPAGYMGISDFFDPETAWEDLDQEDYSLPEVAHIRRVEAAAGSDDSDLKEALRVYLLAGAVKLFRLASYPERYRASFFKHHTMLVHTSHKRTDQEAMAARLKELWGLCAFATAKGVKELDALWTAHFARVIPALEIAEAPASFQELKPFLAQALARIEHGNSIVLVVNSGEDSVAPDFSEAPVWKIVVGGNKLSRGYTVEGLTVSYYRRVANTAETLMQMGRWFGFRPGYRDLVRVFLGVREGRKRVDLVAEFKEVCRLEERFREDIKRYVRTEGAKKITPRDVHPLIEVTGNLPPTSKNKMKFATVVSKNFGGRRSMQVRTAETPTGIERNLKLTHSLLKRAQDLRVAALGGVKGGKKVSICAVVGLLQNGDLLKFLTEYTWQESVFKQGARPRDTQLQLEFLDKEKHEIKDWLLVAPQRNSSFGAELSFKGLATKLTVKHRGRSDGLFQVVGEPAHRTVAEYISVVSPGADELTSPTGETAALVHAHRGVLLLYPIREFESSDVSVGFELQFPNNNLKYDTTFTAASKRTKPASKA